MTSSIFDIAIVGGGLAGQTLAAALRHFDFSVALIEGSSLSKADDRVTALNASSVRLYERIGLWPNMAKTAQPMHDLRVFDGPKGPGISFEDGKAEVEAAAHGYVVHNQEILSALAASRRSDEGLRVYEGTSAHVTDVGVGFSALALADGSQINTHLVCAADGGRSPLRSAAGISAFTRNYKQANITATLTHENDHGGIGFQRFLPGGPAAFIPMTNKQSSLAWTVPQNAAAAILALDDAAFLRLLSDQIFGQDDADQRGPLTLAGPRSTYPICANIAERFHGDRLLLIGDAAHVIHPLAGQGFNLTVRDIGVAVELLSDTRGVGGDLGSAALGRRYSAQRRPDILATFAATDTLNRAYSTRSPGWKMVRRAAMKIGKRQAMLRQLFSAQAQGSVFGLPELMAPKR
ncbi:MAG: FAD-dependent monooxygenase [Pseudomonadota bacterium]